MSLRVALAGEHRAWAEGWTDGDDATTPWVLEIGEAPGRAVLDGAAKVAVLPWSAPVPRGLTRVAVPARPAPSDLFVPTDGAVLLAALPPGSRVALRGPRRAALLGVHRPELAPVQLDAAGPSEPDELLRNGGADALVLSSEEARRLGLSDQASQALEAKAWTPGPGQGAFVLVAREGDESARQLLEAVHHPPTQAALEAEDALSQALGFGPQGALGAVAQPYGRWLRLSAMLAARAGRRLVRAEASGSDLRPMELGRRVARMLQQRGADLLPDPPTGTVGDAA